MIEITGNYWEEAKGDSPRYDALVCTTNKMVKKNGCLVMGAGIARDFRDTFSDIDLHWGRCLSNGYHQNGFMVETRQLSFGGSRMLSLVAFPTKDHWKNDSLIDLIRLSALTLRSTSDIMGWKAILMTRPGCGNGGLEWSRVRNEISFLDDRFRIIDR